MKKTLLVSCIFLLTLVGCNSHQEPTSSHNISAMTRSVNVEDPDGYVGNSSFDDEVYSITEIQTIVYDQLQDIDSNFANEILSCTPTAIPTSQVLPYAVRLAYAYRMDITNDPNFTTQLNKYATTCLYLFTPSSGGYVIAGADRRMKNLCFIFSTQSFPTDFFDHYSHYALACESYLPRIYASATTMQNDSIELEEEVDRQLIPRLIQDHTDWWKKQKEMRTLTKCVLNWWERPDIYPPYISWNYTCSIDTMDMEWTQEYPYNQYFQDNGVTGSIPLCIAKLLVYEEIDANLDDFYFRGSVYKRRRDLSNLYHSIPLIALSLNSELRNQLYRYSPAYMGRSFLRSNGFHLRYISQTLSLQQRYDKIMNEVKHWNHPVIAVDGSDWILIVGISYSNTRGDKYMLKIDKNSVGVSANTWIAYDISDKQLYTYSVDSDIEVHEYRN